MYNFRTMSNEHIWGIISRVCLHAQILYTHKSFYNSLIIGIDPNNAVLVGLCLKKILCRV